MNYKKTLINSELIQTNPIGIWQANKKSYSFLEAKYSIYLAQREVKISTHSSTVATLKEEEIFAFEFPGDLSLSIKKCLELLEIDNARMFGFISYDYSRHLEKIKGFKHSSDYPDFHFIIPSLYSLKDLESSSNEVELFDLEGRNDYSFLKRAKNSQSENLKNTNSKKEVTQHTLSKDEESFCKITQLAQDYISSGDIYQVVLSNEIEFKNRLLPYEIYNKIIGRNPSAYHFMHSFFDNHLVGASPETMLEYDSEDGKLKMRLVAGTYPKKSTAFNSDPSSLIKDEKEVAEHMMLVDHCRNDIGKFAKTASVEVIELLKLVPLNDIYHLISEVHADLKESSNCLEALESCFPIATLTGTPKIRAMEIISELEDSPRRLFGGAVGLIETSKDLKEQKLDLAVIIRSALLTPKNSYINAGAGIVLDSIPKREFNECLWKAKALKEILL